MDTQQKGVYAIRCGNKIYIGSTAIAFDQRWYQHKYYLRKGNHDNVHLQRLFNKYGASSLEYIILETVVSSDALLEREQYWIDHHHRLVGRKNLINISLSAERPTLGMKASDETRRLQSNLKIGKKRCPESSICRAKLKPEEVIEIAKALENDEGVMLLAEKYKVSPAVISGIKNGKRWRFLFSPDQNFPLGKPASFVDQAFRDEVLRLRKEGMTLWGIAHRLGAGFATIHRITSGAKVDTPK